MSVQPRVTTRARALWAVTIALGLAYLVVAWGFARPGEKMDFGWLERFDLGTGLLLVLLTLYGGAWVLGGRAPRQLPSRGAGWRGALYGVLLLLAAVVVVGSWNVFVEVHGDLGRTDAATAFRDIGYACESYIGKPLAYIMPLGSLVVGPLGWWVGRRAATAPA